MWILILLSIPSVVLLTAMALGKGKITLKEFALGEAIMVLLIVAGYNIAKHQSVSDVEIWNGWLTKAEFYEEWWERVSCRHTISCSHRDKKGRTLHSNDGHRHAYDVDYHAPYYQAETSNSEVLSISNAYYRRTVGLLRNEEYVTILRFSKDHGNGNKYVTSYRTPASEFIPTATDHSFTNYIKASPGTVLRRMGQGDKFDKFIPQYPTVDRSNWRSDRFISVGVPIPGLELLNKKVSEINARLGREKQLNLIILVVNNVDSSYIHALEEKWLGGKKNDFVIVIGSTNYPKIDWVRTMSWSTSEILKIELRDKIQDIGTFEKVNEILDAVESETRKKFTRRPMADFEYLMAGWQPSFGVLLFLIIIGVGASIGLSIYFTENDVFGEEGYRRYR